MAHGCCSRYRLADRHGDRVPGRLVAAMNLLLLVVILTEALAK
jgi:hypothetical protein